ncbi:hypothetical protein SKAU_G00081880 [Synaphobranchus kaupii]|uniref:Uncharacterized protein n=1 Tax=Synaphobranchus kaupii TaxID=118154 RepID=A0A9Q1J3E0_SYNKA|nr:hypothetical protein SKAU_G00081880 [Synaphobranchus kaupii]
MPAAGADGKLTGSLAHPSKTARFPRLIEPNGSSGGPFKSFLLSGLWLDRPAHGDTERPETPSQTPSPWGPSDHSAQTEDHSPSPPPPKTQPPLSLQAGSSTEP